MTDIIDTVQQQEVVDDNDNLDAIVQFFDITLPGYDSGTGAGNYFLFAGLDNDGADQIEFRGNNYEAIPIEITGIEVASSGAIARPTLTVANIPVLTKGIDENSLETTLQNVREAHHLLAGTSGNLEVEIERNDDLIGTKVVYRQAFLSDCNTSSANPNEFPPQTYYIDRIASENNIFVTFELASPMDVERAKIPARNVIGQYCTWQYQGRELGFGGGCTWRYTDAAQHSFFRSNDEKINMTGVNSWSNSAGYSAEDIVTTEETGTTEQIQVWEAIFDNEGKDPRHHRKYWKRIDLCGKTLTSCKKRFQGNASNTDLDIDVPLPFGGFPGSKKFK